MPLGREHLRKNRLTFLYEASAESGEAELHHGAVVQDLSGDVGVLDRVLQVRHEEKIAGLVVARMHGVIEDVGEDSAGAEEGSVRPVDEDAELMDKTTSVAIDIDRGDRGIQSLINNCGFKQVKDDIGLPISNISERHSLSHRCAPSGASQLGRSDRSLIPAQTMSAL